MSDIPDTWVKVGSAEERDDMYEQLEGENSDLRDELTRLRTRETVLVDDIKAVVDCFGCGGDPLKTIANLSPHILKLAEDIGDERAVKALATLDVPDPKEKT